VAALGTKEEPAAKEGANDVGPHARRQMPVRGRALRSRRCVPVRSELPLLAVPRGDRLGVQGVRRIEKEKLTITDGFDDIAVFGEEHLTTPAVQPAARSSTRWCETARTCIVAMGSLVDAPTIRPTEHIFVGSKAPWFEISDDLPQNEEY